MHWLQRIIWYNSAPKNDEKWLLLRCTDSREGQDCRKDRQCGTDNGPCIQSDVIIRPVPRESSPRMAISSFSRSKLSNISTSKIHYKSIQYHTVSSQQRIAAFPHTHNSTGLYVKGTWFLGKLVFFTPLQLPAVQETHTRCRIKL